MTPDTPQDDHEKRYCGARKRQGEGNCTRPAGWGTTHVGAGTCKLHGGSTRTSTTGAHKQIAARAVTTYGLPRDVDPRQALLEEVHRTAGIVAWLDDQVRTLDTDNITWGVTEQKAGEKDNTLTQAAAVNMWIQLYQQERKHLIAVCKAAIDAGIEERRVQLAEQQGSILASAIRAILADLNLTDTQQNLVAEIVPKHLRAIAAQ